MSSKLGDKLVVAISSRALFDLDESHAIYEKQGVEAYSRYQIENEDKPLPPGAAYQLVKKLLALNNDKSDNPVVEVVLLSRNSADTGLRIFNSIQHYQLDITRAAFTSGRNPYGYVSAFASHLFLSTNPNDVRTALDNGHAAATILPRNNQHNESNTELRFAFDGDAVIFSDEAEQIYKKRGLKAFTENETTSANQPLMGGPFKSFLAALHRLQKEYSVEKCPIRTALVTARSAPAHERVIRTLRDWQIRIDEALFLGGMPKGQFLRSFEADVFFDDQTTHCDDAAEHVATGHVPHGVANN
ncbi:5'-nucleotidase [Aliikangiella coralliicola]|uniref:5'-nucleotidase n=1 Tax=Aliikangiella coralliicola TaxID=2592383 RepID=A0A545U0B7_9GAMM|nr:5'-nucleotidase [Aliikangiella coralliicola]TQV82904.1 5'-nucleotidase [Aliikangiella coralliicola]